jgi:methenyltetrahydrofolate cyclohydrolase
VTVSLKKSAAEVDRHQSLLDVRTKTSALIASLSDLADADSSAFQCYMEACALPHITEGEKNLRRTAKEASLVRATQVPLDAAAEMGRGVEIAEVAARLVETHVRSEVLAGEVLLRASIKSVLLSVDANLSGISDTTIRDSLKMKRRELELASTGL